MKKYFVVVIGATALISGCAVQNTQQQIDSNALAWFASRSCAQQGFMDKTTAAKGMALASSHIYRSESPRLRAKLEEIERSGQRPNKSDCESFELRILEVQATEDRQARSPAPTYTPPKSVNCMTVEGWTHCTSF